MRSCFLIRCIFLSWDLSTGPARRSNIAKIRVVGTSEQVRHYAKGWKREAKVIEKCGDGDDTLDDEIPRNKVVDIAQISAKAETEMKRISEILIDELNRHFSLRSNLKSYENLTVKLDDGQTRKLPNLGRISIKNQNLITINFCENPSAIKAAKIAIENNIGNTNPQQEGTLLMIQLPRPSREHRLHLVQRANSVILNNYKKALNEVYSKYEKQGIELNRKDEQFRLRESILMLKKKYERLATEKIKEKKEIILKEVV